MTDDAEAQFSGSRTAEIIENLQAAQEQFRLIAEELGEEVAEA